MFTLTRGVHPQPWRMARPDRCWPVRLCTTRLVWTPLWFYCLRYSSTGFLSPNQQPDWLVPVTSWSCEGPVNQTMHMQTIPVNVSLESALSQLTSLQTEFAVCIFDRHKLKIKAILLDTKSLHTLYCALVLPCFQYCAEVSGNNYKTSLQSFTLFKKEL